MATTRDPALSWVVYTSAATSRFDGQRLARLLAQSREANARRDITGLLLYRDGFFLQAIEGPTDAVDDLVALIRADPRHHEVDVIVDEAVDERRFPSWAMGYPSWSGVAGRLPAQHVAVFDRLADASRTDDTAREVRELMEWFRGRPLTDADRPDR